MWGKKRKAVTPKVSQPEVAQPANGSAILSHFLFWMAPWLPQDQRRNPRGLHDFGDDATIGCNLIRTDITPLYKQGDFGVFLGQHPSGWVVGVKHIKGTLFPDHFVGCIIYPSLEALKTVWMAQ